MKYFRFKALMLYYRIVNNLNYNELIYKEFLMDNQNDTVTQPLNQQEPAVIPSTKPTLQAPVVPQVAPVQEYQPPQPVIQQPVVNTPPQQQSNSQQAPQFDTSIAPSEWPGAFAGFKQVRPTIKKVWLTIFLVYLGYGVISGIIGSILKNTIINNLLSLILGTLVAGTLLSIYYAVLRHEDTSASVAFKNATSKFLSLLVVSIAVYFICFLSFIALIVPFFFIAPRVMFAPYLVIGEGLEIGDSISKSWSMTKGHLGKIYGLWGLMILISLLLLTVIGIPFAVYWLIIAYGLSVQLARFMYGHTTAPIIQQQTQVPTISQIAAPPVV
jgi:hypothetical protein